jgi:acetyltransferase-like isoleucine patch superfamily enzyme
VSFRVLLAALIAVLPQGPKRWCYRTLLHYRLGKGVQIGLSFIDAHHCEIEDGVVIGHFNVFTGTGHLRLGEHARVGHLNIIRGGAEVNLGSYSEILRLNEINAISRPDSDVDLDQRFILGDGAVVTTGHKIDFTNRVRLGRKAVMAGRNSTIWTHTRQSTAPVEIGNNAYLASEVRVAAGVTIPDRTVVGMGAVVVDSVPNEGYLVVGVPAKPKKPLGPSDISLIESKTRRDLPDGF